MNRTRARLSILSVLAMVIALLPAAAASAAAATGVSISELHYDNSGSDVGEFVEVTGDAGGDLTGWSVVLYNGNGGASYDTIALAGTIPNEDGSQGAVAFFPSSLQNGSPDGLALVDDGGVVIEFLSYEGAFTAVGGPADGMTSTNLGVSESSSTPIGESLQVLSGVWTGPAAESPGLLNTAPPPPPPPVSAKIHDVQGPGFSSPMVGTAVIIEGVVVGDFQTGAEFKGFHVQEEDSDVDADAATSEGIFVFDDGFGVDVAIGDVVEVTGTVSEFFGLTEITTVTSVVVKSSGATVTPTVVTLPLTTSGDLEAYEGMKVTFPQDLVISEYFNFDRFGEIVLTTDRQIQPTAIFEPGSPAAAALATAQGLARITLDDGRGGRNPDPARHPNGATFDLTNRFRGGDLVTDVTGVIDYAFGKYKIQPTAGATYTAVNPRQASPDPVGGSLAVATFNVLNYFTTLDDSGAICGPDADQGCRGADNADEFTRQRDKIISALATMDADVVGLMEIENHATDAALVDLVTGLNAVTAAGTYDYVATGPVGDDVIKVALIYKPSTVTPSGVYAVLDTTAFLDPNNTGSGKNRAALAQTFVEVATGEAFTVAVNHLKSKGSSCGSGDDDPEAGSCNLTRTLAAQELADWLASDPTGSGDSDILIIGDLNSYDKEDPIDALIAGADDTVGTSDDYTDLVRDYVGEDAYTFVFSGKWGYLDYVMANTSIASQVTGATIWNINADEPDILDYDTSFKKHAQYLLYEPNQFRSSDHDPVIVGLRLDQTPPEVEAEFERIWASRRTGLYTVEYECEDLVDSDPSCVGTLNGMSIEDGQRVFLIKSSGRTWQRMIRGTLFIKARSFTLEVVGTDANGNTATETAEPRFKTRRWWHRSW
ncbi:MAG: hypothetical protein BMS9Abin17_0569 [Acidimicrobiia bacterium]|nr:MAG: hypothetical protein BMS9Abin17_0569 [Acidimicrobiia bacterium]